MWSVNGDIKTKVRVLMGRKIESYAELLELERSNGTLESNAVIKSILVRINKGQYQTMSLGKINEAK